MYQRTYQPKDVLHALEQYQILKSFRKTSLMTGISKSTIHRWWNSLRYIVKRKSKRKRRAKKNTKYPNLKDDLKKLFNSLKRPLHTLKEIQRALQYLETPSLSWIHFSLLKAKVSRRRFQTTKVCSMNTDRMLELYKAFWSSLNSLKDDEIICLDETGFCNLGNPVYGYFAKGKVPECIRVPKRVKVSLVMAIHPCQGVVSYKQQNEAFNKDGFLRYLKENFITSIPEGTKAVIMDNVAFHRSKEVVEFLKAHGLICLYIPPYSPRCNPIEEVFSWLKRKYRSVDPTTLSFNERIQVSLDALNLYKDMAPYYRHAREHVQRTCLTLRS